MSHEMPQSTQPIDGIPMAIPLEEEERIEENGGHVFVRVAIIIVVALCFGAFKGVLLGLIRALSH